MCRPLYRAVTVALAGTGSGVLFANGFVVHSAVHMARPELHAAVHSHHEDTTAGAEQATLHPLLNLWLQWL